MVQWGGGVVGLARAERVVEVGGVKVNSVRDEVKQLCGHTRTRLDRDWDGMTGEDAGLRLMVWVVLRRCMS